MADARRLLQLIRKSLTPTVSPSSPLSRSKFSSYRKYAQARTWNKGIEPTLPSRLWCSHWKFFIPKDHLKNFYKLGCKSKVGCIFGASVVFGSISLWPGVAYAMDGHDILVDDRHSNLWDASDPEEDPWTPLVLARKLWLPVFVFFTVLRNWDHPLILVTKVVLLLLITKPRPLSVYLFVEQLRRQFMLRRPLLYKFHSLYAKKVEVEDYGFLCIAKVELDDQKFTLIGILGSWWSLPL